MNRDDITCMARGVTAFDARWYESIQPGDFIADKASGDVAVVVDVHKQRPISPDYFRLDFADGSYLDATDNELAAEYRPYILPSKIAALVRADEREACAKVCETKLGPTATDYYGKTYAAAIRARGQA
jgi:hypothetical protein